MKTIYRAKKTFVSSIYKPEELYSGALGLRHSMGFARKAYTSWNDQRIRCYNKKNKDYCRYGAKGIRVLYSSREFITWYLKEITKIDLTDPVVSRVDHSKSYTLDNISLEERSENSKEVCNRLGPPTAHHKSVLVKDHRGSFTFSTLNDACKYLRLSPGNLSGYLNYGRKVIRRELREKCHIRWA